MNIVKKNSQNELKRGAMKLAATQKACGLHCIKINDFAVKIGQNQIIENINLHVHCGKMTAIIGQNGAGKSTLVKAIIGEIPHEGNIEFTDKRTNSKMRLNIGYVPQQLNVVKNTPVSVYDFFAGSISDYPAFLPRRKKTYATIKNHLKRFEADSLIDKAICDLSGGELQRVLLSMAIKPVPNLLLLDEPVSGMDKNGMELFYKNINRLKRNYDLAVILISHDLEYVAKYADYVVLLNKSIVIEGTPYKVFNSEEFKDVFGNVSYEQILMQRKDGGNP